MTIKLFSLAKDFNIGINTLVEKLQEKGFAEVTANPNTRIGKEEFDCLTKEFGKEIPIATVEKLRKKFDAKGATAPKEKASDSPLSLGERSEAVAVSSKSTPEIPIKVPESLKPSLKIVGDIKEIAPDPSKKSDRTPPTTPENDDRPSSKMPEAKKEDSQAKTEQSKSISESTTITTTPSQKKHETESVGEKEKKTAPKPTSVKIATKKPSVANKPLDNPTQKDTSQPATRPLISPNTAVSSTIQGKTSSTKSTKKETKETHPATMLKQSPEKKDSVAAITSNPEVKADNQSEAEKLDKPKRPLAKEAEELFRAGGNRPEMGVKVVGSIDLAALNSSTRPSRKTKEERNKERTRSGVKGSATNTTGERTGRKRISGQAIDVKAEGAKISENRPTTDKNRRGDRNNSNSNPNRSRNSHSVGNPKRPPVRAEVKDEDVQKQVKETLARLTNKKTSVVKGAKYRKDKREAASRAAHDARELENSGNKTLKLTEFVTVSDLANMMDVAVNEVIATCMSIGLMVSINMRLDAETINLVTEEFGFDTEFVSADVVESIQSDEEEDREEDLQSRPPIVTVMGHVDHGKTSLLDNIRKTNVIAGEAGGITQHIGAYNLKLQSGRHITFLDTPGHEAFTAMRARGAKVTDIAIIIIAADDSVMPQTREAINHAAAAGVPMVFAINKIDKPGANPEKIREELAGMNYLVEDWGGKYQCQEISAKQGLGVNELLEKVLLEAEMLELKANPQRKAVGSIIESSLDKGRGYVATVLVQNGTLQMGDVVLAGTNQGRIKAMFNERNMRVKKAGPSEPVLILGLDGAPAAGDIFHVLESEQEARSIANKREQLQREQNDRTRQMLTLDILARRREIGNFQELNVIVKGDVDGSVEALGDSLIKLSTEEIQVNVIHKGVGQVSESDVVLAAASSAVIISFQVRPSVAARRLADQEGIEIRTYSIIYDAIEDVKSAMEGMLSPEIREEVSGSLRVMQAFKITKVGTIAGCMVEEGKVRRSSKVRLIRDGIVVFTGKLGSLKRFKDDVKEVVAGLDCGLNLDGFNDIREGDIIEAFDEIEIKKTL